MEEQQFSWVEDPIQSRGLLLVGRGRELPDTQDTPQMRLPWEGGGEKPREPQPKSEARRLDKENREPPSHRVASSSRPFHPLFKIENSDL